MRHYKGEGRAGLVTLTACKAGQQRAPFSTNRATSPPSGNRPMSPALQNEWLRDASVMQEVSLRMSGCEGLADISDFANFSA